MAKARAILKRRKAVRNIRKITKTMQMIATAKFQKSLKRAVATKPYTLKVSELVGELARSVGNVEHPMLRKVDASNRLNKVAMIVLTADRGLAGAYNGSILRHASKSIRELEAEGKTVELFVTGKKGHSFFSFQKRAFTKAENFPDAVRLTDVERAAGRVIDGFVSGLYDAIYVVYMNFISTGQQKPNTMMLLPLSGATSALEHIASELAEKEAQIKAGALDSKRRGETYKAEEQPASQAKAEYEFIPDAASLLNELLPLTVKTALYQSVLDAKTSEHVARMVAMKSATDNAEKMGKSLAMQYNRARQTQITTELSEIMGGVEAMK